MTPRPAIQGPSAVTSGAATPRSVVRTPAPIRGTTIIDAMNDPNLFGPFFRGPSYDMWRAYLKALFALPMNATDMKYYELCTGRLDVSAEPYRESSIIIGRRGGKSLIMGLTALYLGCFIDYAPFLAPGEKATIAILCVNKDQARNVMGFIKGLIARTPFIASMVTNATDEDIELNNDVRIEISASSFRTTRGYSFACVIADEIAFFRSNDTSANPDVELIRALRPGLITLRGKLIMASSPFGKSGVLWDSYVRNHGVPGARVLCWKAPTRVGNPTVPQSDVDQALEDDPESARAEYMADFRSDVAAFLDRDMIEAVTAAGRHEVPPMDGVQYTAYMDVSGGSGADSTALAIAHSEGSIIVHDFLLEIRPPFNPDDAVAQIVAVLRRYNIVHVIADRWGSQWVSVRFQEQGIDVAITNRTASQIYRDALPMFTSRSIELLDFPRLANQLMGLQRTVSRNGNENISHPSRSHDDIANVVCGALVNCDLDRRPALVRQVDLMVDGGTAFAIPPLLNGMFAVISADDLGGLAVVYFGIPVRGTTGNVKLILLDFQANPIGATLLKDTWARLIELTRNMRVRQGAVMVFAPESLVAGNVDCRPIPDVYMKPDTGTTLRFASHIRSGAVKFSQAALDRADSLPIASAFEFRAGDKVITPLRLAALAAVMMTLET